MGELSKYLGGTAEVAELLDCSRQQVAALRAKEDFPAPLCSLAATPVWDLRLVADFKDHWRRRQKVA